MKFDESLRETSSSDFGEEYSDGKIKIILLPQFDWGIEDEPFLLLGTFSPLTFSSHRLQTVHG